MDYYNCLEFRRGGHQGDHAVTSSVWSAVCDLHAGFQHSMCRVSASFPLHFECFVLCNVHCQAICKYLTLQQPILVVTLPALHAVEQAEACCWPLVHSFLYIFRTLWWSFCKSTYMLVAVEHGATVKCSIESAAVGARETCIRVASCMLCYANVTCHVMHIPGSHTDLQQTKHTWRPQ